MVSVFFKTFKSARWIINSGYFLGVFPFYWDTARNITIIVKSRFAWARFYVSTAIFFFTTLLVVLGFFASVVFDFLELSKIDKLFTAIKFIAIFGLALLHAHTYWKLHEIISFANCSSEFGESFLGKLLLIINNNSFQLDSTSPLHRLTSTIYTLIGNWHTRSDWRKVKNTSVLPTWDGIRGLVLSCTVPDRFGKNILCTCKYYENYLA